MTQVSAAGPDAIAPGLVLHARHAEELARFRRLTGRRVVRMVTMMKLKRLRWRTPVWPIGWSLRRMAPGRGIALLGERRSLWDRQPLLQPGELVPAMMPVRRRFSPGSIREAAQDDSHSAVSKDTDRPPGSDARSPHASAQSLSGSLARHSDGQCPIRWSSRQSGASSRSNPCRTSIRDP